MCHELAAGANQLTSCMLLLWPCIFATVSMPLQINQFGTCSLAMLQMHAWLVVVTRPTLGLGPVCGMLPCVGQVE